MPVQRELARFSYRYLLDDVDFRRWFQNARWGQRGYTALVAEWDRLIIKDWRVYWMGHKDDIEAT